MGRFAGLSRDAARVEGEVCAFEWISRPRGRQHILAGRECMAPAGADVCICLIGTSVGWVGSVPTLIIYVSVLKLYNIIICLEVTMFPYVRPV